MTRHVRLSFLILLMLFVAENSAAKKPLAVGDIAGRDLSIPGLGWAGHVGLGTGGDTGTPTQVIIEVLNETSVVQFNSLENFTSRSRYWGSRSGLGKYATAALAEALRQSWWCPTYTASTVYIVGQGNPQNRQATRCGMWRCDTFIAWNFASAGAPQVLHSTMLPPDVFYMFPDSNEDGYLATAAANIPFLTETDKQFSELTAQELNQLSYPKFVELADIPLNEETPTHIAKEWEFIADTKVNAIKRGIFIDRLAASAEPDVIPRFSSLYEKESQLEIRSKLIQGIMINYQNYPEKIDNNFDMEALKGFYTTLLNSQSRPRDKDKIIRGYIDFHTAEEILANRMKLDEQLAGIEPRLALGLRQELAYRSKELEQIYIPSIIKMLRQYNRSDLDAMFFGITQLWYKNLRDKNSIQQIKEYLNLKKKNYLGTAQDSKDFYARVAKISFKALYKVLAGSQHSYKLSFLTVNIEHNPFRIHIKCPLFQI